MTTKENILVEYLKNVRKIYKLEFDFNYLETWDEMNENLIERKELELENLKLAKHLRNEK